MATPPSPHSPTLIPIPTTDDSITDMPMSRSLSFRRISTSSKVREVIEEEEEDGAGEGNGPPSPLSSRFSRKLHRRSKKGGLDFGCAGNKIGSLESWENEGPSELNIDSYHTRKYSTTSRSSVSSSGTLPSLTHSRAESSSSDFSSSTQDSTPPPSPRSYSTSGPSSSFSPPSKLSLPPRRDLTTERKRRTASEEVLAIDALNEYFARARLSRVEEDESSRRPQENSLPPLPPISTTSSDLPRHNSVSHPSLSLLAPSRICTSSASDNSNNSTLPAHSPNLSKPSPSLNMADDLDDLSDYFSRPSSCSESVYSRSSISSNLSLPTSIHQEIAKNLPTSQSVHLRAESEGSTNARRGLGHRPQVRSMDQNLLKPDRAIPYGWI